jgi:CRP-like cAMP-binding protein
MEMNALQQQKRARDLTAEDRAEIIRHLEFGSTLDDALVSEMARNSVVLDFRRRRFVYRAGEAADCLYAIVHGRIKLCRIEPESGREAVIDILPEGSLFGESALYSAAGQRANSAIAYENSRLLRIQVGDFKRGMAEDNRIHESVNDLITPSAGWPILLSMPFPPAWTVCSLISRCVTGFPSPKACLSISLCPTAK